MSHAGPVEEREPTRLELTMENERLRKRESELTRALDQQIAERQQYEAIAHMEHHAHELVQVHIAAALAACRTALDWCVGKGRFADGNDTHFELAETVAPMLGDVLNGTATGLIPRIVLAALRRYTASGIDAEHASEVLDQLCGEMLQDREPGELDPADVDLVEQLRQQVQRLDADRAVLVGACEAINEGCDDEDQLTLSGDYGNGLRCGVEDRGHQRDGYAAAERGFREGVERTVDWAQGIVSDALEKVGHGAEPVAAAQEGAVQG